MLFDIARFNSCAVRVLGEGDNLSIGEYLRREGYSPQIKDNYSIGCMSPLTRHLCGRFECRISP
jgi:hypothetical protein